MNAFCSYNERFSISVKTKNMYFPSIPSYNELQQNKEPKHVIQEEKVMYQESIDRKLSLHQMKLRDQSAQIGTGASLLERMVTDFLIL